MRGGLGAFEEHIAGPSTRADAPHRIAQIAAFDKQVVVVAVIAAGVSCIPARRSECALWNGVCGRRRSSGPSPGDQVWVYAPPCDTTSSALAERKMCCPPGTAHGSTRQQILVRVVVQQVPGDRAPCAIQSSQIPAAGPVDVISADLNINGGMEFDAGHFAPENSRRTWMSWIVVAGHLTEYRSRLPTMPDCSQ